MRRTILMLLVCVPLLLMTVAVTPAFGWAVEPAPGAYVFPFSGSWHEITPDGQDILHDWTPVDPNDPEGDWKPPDAIPADLDIWIAFRWVSPTPGIVQTLPLGLQVKLDIYPVVDVNADPWELGDLAFSVPTYADGAKLWSHAYPWDGDPIGSFNGKVRAKVYAIDWWAPVGHLEPGLYLMFTTQRYVHAIADLSDLRTDPVTPYPDQFTPIVNKRGVVESVGGFMVEGP